MFTVKSCSDGLDHHPTDYRGVRGAFRPSPRGIVGDDSSTEAECCWLTNTPHTCAVNPRGS